MAGLSQPTLESPGGGIAVTSRLVACAVKPGPIDQTNQLTHQHDEVRPSKLQEHAHEADTHDGQGHPSLPLKGAKGDLRQGRGGREAAENAFRWGSWTTWPTAPSQIEGS